MLDLKGKGITPQQEIEPRAIVRRVDSDYYINIDNEVIPIDFKEGCRVVYSTPSNNRWELNTKRILSKDITQSKLNAICRYWSIYKTNHKYKYYIKDGKAIIII